MENRVCKLLGIEHPIIQAPMAGTSTVAMAAAVSNAGALGSIALGASNHVHARKLIEEMQEETDAPFNLNFFCHAPAEHDAAREARWLAHLAPFFAEFDAKPPVGLKEIYKSFVEDEDMLDLVLAMPPRAVSFHFGLPPGPCISALKKAGCVLLAGGAARDASVASVGGCRGYARPRPEGGASAGGRTVGSVARRARIQRDAGPYRYLHDRTHADSGGDFARPANADHADALARRCHGRRRAGREAAPGSA